MKQLNWYHALPLALLGLAAFATGGLYLWLGASLSEPRYLLDDIFLRLLGAALVAGGALALLRRHLGYTIVGVGFALGALEFAVGSVLAAQSYGLRNILLICGGLLALATLAFSLDFIFNRAALAPEPEPALKQQHGMPNPDSHWLTVLMQYLVVMFTVAAVALLASAPLVSLSLSISLSLLGGLAVLFFLVNGLPGLDRRTLAPLLGFATASLLLLPISGISERMEHGFVDGPYLGTAYTAEFKKLRPAYRLKYRNGTLAVYNRDGRAPLLAYFSESRLEWATELYVPPKAGARKPVLLRISSPSVHGGLLRDKLDFTSHSAADSGHGEAYIWRFGGIQRFYLKW